MGGKMWARLSKANLNSRILPEQDERFNIKVLYVPALLARPFLALANEIYYLFIYSGRDELYEDFNSASAFLEAPRSSKRFRFRDV